MERLTAGLRATASQAAELAGGGCCLLFAAAPGDDAPNAASRLRAAAGFDSPEQAKSASSQVMSLVALALERGEARGQVAALGARAAGGVSVLSLSHNGCTHGALAVGAPSGLTPQSVAWLAELATRTALELENAQLALEIQVLNDSLKQTESTSSEKGDELLKLSEALFAQDIELLRNNEKLGKIEKLKNDFIEKMSRELRTPLNSIIEAVISVLAGENEHLSESAKTSLRSALDEGTAFQRTLQNILDLWRIKQSELPVEIQELNFAEVVEEAIFSVQETIGSKPVTIRKEFQGTLPKVKADLAKTNQILFLLLDNAAKFTERGEIVISARVDESRLVCTVKDTGIGVCPDDQQFVFDEFFEVDELSSTRYRGLSLFRTSSGRETRICLTSKRFNFELV